MGIYSAFKKNDFQKHKKLFLGSKAPPVREADNITIGKQTVYTM
jgi:hypothetical protein